MTEKLKAYNPGPPTSDERRDPRPPSSWPLRGYAANAGVASGPPATALEEPISISVALTLVEQELEQLAKVLSDLERSLAPLMRSPTPELAKDMEAPSGACGLAQQLAVTGARISSLVQLVLRMQHHLAL